MSSKPSILVTGTSGLLGRYVLAALREAEYSPISVNRTRTVDGPAILADLADKEEVAKLPTNVPCIIHLAAHVPASERDAKIDTALRANTLGTLNLLEFAAAHGIKNFVYGSSCAVYGSRPLKVPVREDDPVAPDNPYAFSKLAGELMIFPYEFYYGLNAKKLRFSYIYGDGMRRTTAICTFIDLARTNRDITLFNGGADQIDLVYAKDAASAVLRAVNAPAGAYNVGSGTTVTVREIAETIVKLTGSTSRMQTGPAGKVIRDSYMAIDEASANLDWRPAYDLKAGLRDFLKTYV